MAPFAAYRTVAIVVIGSVLFLYLVSWFRERGDGDRRHQIKETSDILNSVSSLKHEDVQYEELFDTSLSFATARPNAKVPSPTGGLELDSSSILRVGEALKTKAITSPSGRYRFSLRENGDLSLIFMVTGEEVFSSDTKFYWPADFQAMLTPSGVLELTWHNEAARPYRGKPWESSMLPDCDGIVPKTVHNEPFLELKDSGLLQIRNKESVICTLHKPREDRGRLAIVYAGYLRTYLETCEGHYQKFVKSWSGTGGVDVHIFTYLEEVFHGHDEHPTRDSIERNLRACFGNSLKTLSIIPTNETAETWDDVPNTIVSACDQKKLNRHISQFKTIYLASLQVQKYMIQTGVQYDYILKARLDLLLHGSIPRLDSLDAHDGKIILPRVAMDWTWYTLFHDGTLHAGTTDITAFGKASSMWTYLGFYREMKNLLTIEKEEPKKARWPSVNTHGTRKVGIQDSETCTPENALGYWLGLNGIKVQTEWRFEMGLLRRDGQVVFKCPEEGRKWMCPGFIP